MLGSLLRDFERKVSGVHNFLLYAADFVSEYQGILAAGLPAESVQFHRMDGLFHGYYGVSFRLQAFHQGHHIVHVLGRDGLLRSERHLVQVCGRRDGTDAAQPDFVHTESVAGAESASDVVRAADIVQHQHQSAFGTVTVRIGRHASQFYIEKFSVFHIAKVKVFS